MDSSTSRESTTSNDSSSSSLLEILRAKKCNWDHFVEDCSYDPTYPSNLEAAKENKELLIRHQSEFPPKLRRAIATAAAADTNPHEFVEEVYLASKAFFLGRTIDPNDPSVLCTKVWNGPDDTIDSSDQVEAAIRFFPGVLRENVLNSFYPIHLLFTFHKAVSFVPLVLKLHDELKIGMDHYMLSLAVCKQLLVPGKAIYLETGASWAFGYSNALFGKEFDFCNDLDEASLSTLVGSEAWNQCIPRDTDALLKWLLGSNRTKEAGFLEKRLRLLIDTKPSVLRQLKRTSDKDTPLLHVFFKYSSSSLHQLRLFQVVFELGMKHYPQELGFAFSSPFFEDFCRWHGNKTISNILQGSLLRLSSKTRTLQWLFVVAASNEQIGLDGVYMLLRLNPLAVIGKRTSTTSIGTDGSSSEKWKPSQHTTKKRKKASLSLLLRMDPGAFILPES